MKILITGIAGMVGTHWALAALKNGWQVFGIDRVMPSNKLLNSIQDKIFNCDILDGDALQDVFIETKPELILHLAAQSFNALSWNMEELTHNTNYMGTLKMLQTIRKIVPKSKVILASSSVVYGVVKPEDCPLSEERAIKPVTPYAVTKAANEHLGYQYFSNFNLKIFLPRFFGLLGPGHSPNTATQSFAKQLALISKGKQKPLLQVGNLEAARDYMDVRDGVAAMLTLLKKGKPGEPINVCSGMGIKISEILDMLINISGLKVKVQQDSSLNRPSDEPLLYGDNRKLKELGWKQSFSMEDTLKTIYKNWQARIENSLGS